eukprot:scaffold35661_cov20-Tisochrysis_lutea.AAC.7
MAAVPRVLRKPRATNSPGECSCQLHEPYPAAIKPGFKWRDGQRVIAAYPQMLQMCLAACVGLQWKVSLHVCELHSHNVWKAKGTHWGGGAAIDQRSLAACMRAALNSSQIRGTHWGGGAAGDQRSLAACMCVAVMVVRERHARSSIMHGAFWGGLLCGGTAPQEGAWKQCVCV